MYTEIDPLMDETEAVEGDLWLSGNRTLIALNLSSNKTKQQRKRHQLKPDIKNVLITI
jgi:hypothetical protein